MSTDYTTLITSEHSGQPKFNATVALTANAVGDISDLLLGFPALFDLDAAIGAQEDVDGQWIGFSRAVNGVLLVQFFGYADDITALTFGELGNAAVGGRFIELGEDATATSTLSDPEYRLTLRAKILQNFWDGSISQLIDAMVDLGVVTLPASQVFAIDPGTSVVSIFPPQLLDQTLYQLLTSYDLLPRPAGVRYQIYQPLQQPFSWNVAGTAVANGTQVSKPTGTNLWDSAAWITDPSVAASISFTLSASGMIMMGGLSTNPSASPNFSTLTCGLFVDNALLFVFLNGVQAAFLGAIVGPPGTVYQIYYDKSRFVVLMAGQIIFTSSLMSGFSLSPMICVNKPAVGLVQNIAVQLGV